MKWGTSTAGAPASRCGGAKPSPGFRNIEHGVDDGLNERSSATPKRAMRLPVQCLLRRALIGTQEFISIELPASEFGDLFVRGVAPHLSAAATTATSTVKAARKDRLQTSLNLALGSALATIGLTIPSVAVVSLVMGLPLSLGIGPKSLTLLVLSLFAVTLSLGTGRTTILGGVVHLVIFAVYLFVTVVP